MVSPKASVCTTVVSPNMSWRTTVRSPKASVCTVVRSPKASVVVVVRSMRNKTSTRLAAPHHEPANCQHRGRAAHLRTRPFVLPGDLQRRPFESPLYHPTHHAVRRLCRQSRPRQPQSQVGRTWAHLARTIGKRAGHRTAHLTQRRCARTHWRLILVVGVPCNILGLHRLVLLWEHACSQRHTFSQRSQRLAPTPAHTPRTAAGSQQLPIPTLSHFALKYAPRKRSTQRKSLRTR